MMQIMKQADWWTWPAHHTLTSGTVLLCDEHAKQITFLGWSFVLVAMHLQAVKNRDKSKAVGRRFTTTGIRIRSQGRSCVICGGQSNNGMGFLHVFP
jgi:hypothetical protein